MLRWFLECIALDAYDWVMIPNIWTMGYFTKSFTSRPYITSSNYLNKMSNYKIDKKMWDDLYHQFLNKHS